MGEVEKEAREKLIGTLLELFESDVIAKGEMLEFIECSMYQAIMKCTKGNQSHGADMLGVARGTLRSKLKQYFGTVQVGGLYHSVPRYLGKEACNDNGIVDMPKERIPSLFLVARCSSDEVDCV